jgi:hypothetical protein
MRSTDPKLLARFINLPGDSLEVSWETTSSPAGDNWSLTALLSLTKQQTERILASSRKLDGPAPRLPKAEVRTWLPPAVRSRYPEGAGGSDDSIAVEAVAIDPSRFLAPDRSPLTHGEALLFEGDGLLFLRLFTM